MSIRSRVICQFFCEEHEHSFPLIIEKISKHSKNLFESHLILFNIKQIIAT